MTPNNLKFLRLRAKLTQAEVARRLDVDQGSVSNWERGLHKPSAKYRRALAELYGVDESELL